MRDGVKMVVSLEQWNDLLGVEILYSNLLIYDVLKEKRCPVVADTSGSTHFNVLTRYTCYGRIMLNSHRGPQSEGDSLHMDMSTTQWPYRIAVRPNQRGLGRLCYLRGRLRLVYMNY